VRAVEDDLRTVAEGRVDLRADRAFRHHDGDVDALLAPGPGIGLRGVARGQGDDTVLTLIGRQ
jgi:hypothetical protein